MKRISTLVKNNPQFAEALKALGFDLRVSRVEKMRFGALTSHLLDSFAFFHHDSRPWFVSGCHSSFLEEEKYCAISSKGISNIPETRYLVDRDNPDGQETFCGSVGEELQKMGITPDWVIVHKSHVTGEFASGVENDIEGECLLSELAVYNAADFDFAKYFFEKAKEKFNVWLGSSRIK